MPSYPGSSWAEEKVRRSYTFENLEDQDKVSSKTSAFQREEDELVKPFSRVARDGGETISQITQDGLICVR